jgi:sugar phosphate isomerase/epimerase
MKIKMMTTALAISADDAKFSALALKGDLGHNIQFLAGLGFGGVELAARDPKAVDVSSLNKLISSTGLTVPAIGTGRVFGEDGLSFCDAEQEIRRKAIQRIKGHIELAAELQSQVIIGLVRGICRGPMTHDDAVKWVTEGLEECAAYASSCGVKLTLEAINRYETNLLNTVSECLQMARSIGNGIGILVDTFHMNIEEVDMVESIRNAEGIITHVHFADSNRWAPGCGHIDFAAVIRALREIGYDGAVSAEILPKPSPKEAARLAAAYMKAVVDA